MTLEAAGITDYNDIKYPDRDEWFFKEKGKIPLLLPNLPYFIDGEIAITETTTICRTIAKLYN